MQFAFSNKMALLSLLQHNHAARLVSTNIRYHRIVRPGSNSSSSTTSWTIAGDLAGLAVRNRSLVVKLNYLFGL